eukprot:6177818-Pleurochrysis_carterae.AAC.10
MENLLVSHGLPAEDDRRIFTATLRFTDAGTSNAGTATPAAAEPVPVQYLGGGQYECTIKTERPGNFVLQLQLDGAETGASLAIESACPSFPVRLSPDGASCVCSDNYVESERDGEGFLVACTPCPAGFYAGIGDEACYKPPSPPPPGAPPPPASPPPLPPPLAPPPPATPVSVERETLLTGLNFSRTEAARGLPVVLQLDGGTFNLASLFTELYSGARRGLVAGSSSANGVGFAFDGRLLASELRLVGTGATQLTFEEEEEGVDGGEGGGDGVGAPGRRRTQASGGDAVLPGGESSIFGIFTGSPHITFENLRLISRNRRAVIVDGGSLTLRDCTLAGGRGTLGGAVFVRNGSVRCALLCAHEACSMLS